MWNDYAVFISDTVRRSSWWGDSRVMLLEMTESERRPFYLSILSIPFVTRATENGILTKTKSEWERDSTSFLDIRFTLSCVRVPLYTSVCHTYNVCV